MDSMKCWDCALKHLAGALSYGKEILTGHTKGAELDHRPDLLGELVNCEHHAELLDRELFNRVSTLRKQLQVRHVFVTAEDLDTLRMLYLKTEALSEGRNDEPYRITAGSSAFVLPVLPSSADYPQYSAPLDIVFDRVDNLDFFRLARETIVRYLTNFGTLYVLESQIDLSAFTDVTVVGKTLIEFVNRPELSVNFLLWKQNMGVLQPFDAQRSFPAYSPMIPPEMEAATKFLSEKGCKGKIYLWDDVKPQPVSKIKYGELMKEISTAYPLTAYFSLKNEPKRFNALDTTVLLTQPVCCSNRHRLKTFPFVCWNQAAFASLINFLQQNR